MNEPEPVVERRDHILREGQPPWRTQQLTECGRPVADVATVITREQAKWRHQRIGLARMSFTTCVTCLQTANTAPQWETDPTATLFRDCRRNGHGTLVYYEYDHKTGTRSGPHVDQIGVELHAIADLIAAYPEMFATQVQARTDAALFAARRREKERRDHSR